MATAVNISTSSSAGFTLKKNYCKLLFPFVCKRDLGDIDPQPILTQMETPQKKDKRAQQRQCMHSFISSISARMHSLSFDKFNYCCYYALVHDSFCCFLQLKLKPATRSRSIPTTPT